MLLVMYRAGRYDDWLGWIVFLLIGLNASVSAQHVASIQDTVQLDEVQVTAARYTQSLRWIAAPVQLIGFSQLNGVSSGDLPAALSSVPGVQLQSGTAQTLKLTLRGIGSRSQYGTNRTRVFLNDIPLTGGDGTSVFDDLELAFIQRAEITKGSYSAWYGSGMGGSVRFVTRRLHESAAHNNKSDFFAEAGISTGSFGHLKLHGLALKENSRGFLSAGIARVSGEGYRENSAYSRTSGILTGEHTLIQWGKLNYLFMLSDVSAYTPSSVDETTFYNQPTDAAPNWLAVKGFKEYQRWLTGVKLETGQLTDRWSNTLLFTLNNYDQHEVRPFNLLDDRSVSLSIQESFRYSASGLSAVIGVESLLERYNWTTSTNETKTELTNSQELRQNLNIFSAVEHNPVEKLRLSLAANINVTNYKLKTYRQSPADAVFESVPILSPLVGIVYQLSDSLSLHGSAGHGFSNPTVEEGLGSDGIMRTDLQPEQGWSFDLGIKSSFFDSRLTLQGSIYNILLKNLLIIKRPEEDVFYGENVGRSVLRGVEGTFGFRPFKWLNYTVSASLCDNRFRFFEDERNDYKGKQLPGIPSLQIYSDLLADLPLNLNLQLSYRSNGPQFANDANTVKIKGWQTVNIRLQYESFLFKVVRITSQFSVANLFNEHYASMVLINAPSFSGRSPRYYYPALPRNFNLGLHLRW